MQPFLSYGKQSIDEDDVAAVVSVLKGDFLTQGPIVDSFEKSLAEYCGARFCVTFSNATAALHCAVKALNIPEDSEGVTSTNTFVASANCLAYNNITPVFADIDPNTYNVTGSTISRKLTPATKVLIPVHFAGQPCDMANIKALANENNLYVIEDASHAIGSTYADKYKVGCCNYSDMTVFSFHPVKTMTTGEGGAVTTNNESLYKRLKLLRSHGITRDPEFTDANPGPWYYEQIDLGFNYRMTDIQAGLGITQLKKLPYFKKRRRDLVDKYNELLSEFPEIRTPFELADLESCFHLYVVRIDFERMGLNRANVMSNLREQGVGSQVHYIPVHTQPWYRKNFGYAWGQLPEAESYYRQALSLPLYPMMQSDDVVRVVTSLRRALAL